MARPKKADTLRRTRQFTVRFTEEGAAAVEAAATSADMRVAEWLNQAAQRAAEAQPDTGQLDLATGLESAGDGHVVGLMVLDRTKRPYLLTTTRAESDRSYPCILRWDQTASRWVNTSDERSGKDTARALMDQLSIDEGGAEITHQFVFRLVRKAWNRLEDVLYDRIRK